MNDEVIIYHMFLFQVMANSDNVVRAGLTPKLIDTPTLVSMLDYTCTPASLRYFTPTQASDTCLEFDPPVPDFSVAKLVYHID